MVKPYWIKERHNPQLGVYYVAMGQKSVREAKKFEKSLYGMNYMHRFDSEREYIAELEKLRAAGETIR